MADSSQSDVDVAVEMLEDDAFRRGGSVTHDSILRICERLKLNVGQVVEVRQRLEASEIAVEEAAEKESKVELSAEGEPSDKEIVSVVQTYLRDAGRFDLLTKEEEVITMRRIRAGEAAAVELAGGSADPAGNLAKVVEDGRKARNSFLEKNLRLVVFMAKNFKRKSHLQVEDLIQEGNLGLMKAIEKWDHTRGLRFSTYATWWIFQGITRALANKNRLVRIPVHAQQRASKVRRLQESLTREAAGQPPSLQTLAEHLGWPAEQVQFLLDVNREPLSLDLPVAKEGDPSIGESIPDHGAQDPEKFAVARELSRDVQHALSKLKEREAEVLRRRFGDESTLEQIGEDFEVTRERIRQIEAKALKRLRHPSKSKPLSAHLDDVEVVDDEDTET